MFTGGTRYGILTRGHSAELIGDPRKEFALRLISLERRAEDLDEAANRVHRRQVCLPGARC